MTLEEIKDTVASVEQKISELKLVLDDIETCKSEKSKLILTTAASKLAETFKTINNK